MKKKALLFGVSVLAAFGLASCGEEEQKVDNIPNTTETNNDDQENNQGENNQGENNQGENNQGENPTETPVNNDPEDTKTYIRHKAFSPTYTSKGQIEYYTTNEDDNYYDANHKIIEDKNSVYIPAKIYVTKVASIGDDGSILVDTTATDFKKIYNGKFTIDVTIGGKVYSAPTAKWKEEVEEGNAVITTTNGVVRIELNGESLQEKVNVSVGDEVSFCYNKRGYETLIRVFDYLTRRTVSLYGKDIEVEFDEQTKTDVLNLINDIKDKIQEGTVTEEHPDTSNAVAYDVIDGLYQEFIDYYYDLVDQYRYASIIADTTAAAEDIELRTEILNFVESLEVYDQEIDILAAKSIYRNDYFKGKTDEEIDEYITGLNPEESAQAKEYKQAMNEAIALFEKDSTKGYEALSTYVTNATEYAKLEGYDDYLAYAYENVYDREYEYTVTNSLEDYISKYIAPIYEYTKLEFDTFKANLQSYVPTWNNFVGLLYNFYGNYFDDLEAYSKIVGGDYEKNFKQYFIDGNYFYSSLDNQNVTGYVTTYSDGTPLMFLSAYYQGVNTFIHEFGHYNANVTGGDSASYDLSETQSQGNEMLFYIYFSQQDSVDATVMKQYLNYQIYNMTSAIVRGYLINELEKYVYQNPNFTDEDFKNTWTSICNNAGLSEFAADAPYSILLNYPCYYISYSTSAVAALEFYATGLKDYDAAIASYNVVYSVHPEGSTFKDVLVDAGLFDVFTEDAYKLIASAFPYVYE